MSRRGRDGAATRRGRCEMSGFTVVPRWTLKPVPGVGEHEATIPNELVAALRRLANEVAVSLSSVLLTAHGKVLGALSGEPEVWTGYAVEGRPPLPCRMTTERHSWRALLLDAHRAELALLSYRDIAVDDLRRELDLTAPLFETIFDRTPDAGGALTEEIVLSVGIVEHDGLVLRLRYRT